MMERDNRIDFLRFLGLSLIIIAHVPAPYTLTQLRCFDVPLMLFVSGLTSSGKNFGNYRTYVLNRSKRLLIPVWIYLFCYLSILYVAQFYILPKQYLTLEMILRSFLLLDHSIGYVWIIRIFLIVMLLTPFLSKISERCKKIYWFIVVVIISYCALWGIHLLYEQVDNNNIISLSRDIIQYGLAYSIPFLLGLKIRGLSKKPELTLVASVCVISIALFYLYSINHIFPQGISSEYKYPPQLYYIAYGGASCLIIWTLRNLWQKLSTVKFFIWIGQNTIWIYLWHMPFALFATVFIKNWIFAYCFVYSFAIGCFGVQYFLVKKYIHKDMNRFLIG